MADVHVQQSADEIAVALVSALARQDGAHALQLCDTLEPLIASRPALQARHAAWAAQAHRIEGNTDAAIASIKQAISLAQVAEETDAIPALKALKIELVTGRAAGHAAANLPLPDTLLGQAMTALDEGAMEQGGQLARQARLQAQSEGDFREEVFALLALARIPGQEDSAIRAAHGVADQSNDKNLVTAVARAARAANVALPKASF
jgi:hypothetical protein